MSFGSITRSQPIVLLAPVDATARKIIVVIVGEGLVKALQRRPNVHMAFVEGLKACNFGNPAERQRDRGEPGRIAILRDEPKEAQSGLIGGRNRLDFHPL